ncbi:MAG TPA: Crp/Fnr family transcriptional regulator [Leeuwenhoekiella sp.]|nr:Crp/Fnr family transcriptional regulator [Leeuwenhoekiella sp.]
MEKLKSALSFGGILSEGDITIITSAFQQRELKPDEYFQEFGKIADKIAFVNNGVLRVFCTNEQGDDVTKYFVRENQFFADMISYYSTQPATDAIQAATPCKIFWIYFSVFEKLYAEIPGLTIFFKSISESTLLNKIKDNDFLNFGNAKTKYCEFVRRYPLLAQQVPQQYIASYLKITPQSLSRIRNELVKKDKMGL